MTLRPIEKIKLPPGSSRAVDLGVMPELVLVAPTDLLVDEGYQRDLNRRSMVLIAKIVSKFAWRKIKPPIVVRVDGGLHVIDGQHTAIAAATLGVPHIPVFVVDAKTALERADSFVAHNQDRLVMSPMDIYRAKIGGQDPEALQIKSVIEAAGVRFRALTKHVTPKVGDTGSVGVVRQIIQRQGASLATDVLRALVAGERAPISAAELLAAEEVMCGKKTRLTVDQVAHAALDLGSDGIVLCRARAETERMAVKFIIASEYRRIGGKRKAA